MKTYRVTWTIDIEADNPREAAERAREIQLRTDSFADVFEVNDLIDGVSTNETHWVDLSE